MIRPVAVAVTARMAAVRLPFPGARFLLAAPVAFRLTAGGLVRTGTTDRAVSLFGDLAPATRYRLEVDGAAPLDFETRPCTGLIVPDGLIADAPRDDAAAARANAAAVTRAIAAVPAGGTLLLPAGVWTSFPVRLPGDVTLHLAEGAVLRAPATRAGWPVLPARDGAGRMLGSWEGLPAACFAAPVHAIGARRLVIEGRGTLDGSGDAGDWWTWPKETRDGARRPRGLHLVGCSDVTLLGFSIRNAPSWTIHPQGCDRLTAAGLHISAPPDSPNTDGFDPESCRDVTIEGVRFSVGDDCIAVKAGKRAEDGADDHLAETRGVRVRHCRMERGHGGLVIGSEMSGGVHDVTVEDCDMVGTDRGLRIKTRRGRGGAVTGIALRRVRLDGVQTAFSVNAFYHCDADGHAGWVQSRAAAPVGPGTPRVDGITVADVEIHGLAHAAGCFLGLPEAPVRNVRLSGIRILSHDPAAVAAPPVMADGIRPQRHAAVLAEQAEVTVDDPALLSDAPVSLSAEESRP